MSLKELMKEYFRTYNAIQIQTIHVLIQIA